MSRYFALTFTAWAAVLVPAFAGVAIYDFPSEIPRCREIRAYLDQEQVDLIQTKRGVILSFGMSDPVDVELELRAAPSAVAIRPLHAGIRAEITGSTVRFRMERPQNLSVEIDGNLANPVLVFANPERPSVDPSDPSVHYFKAGKVHDVGTLSLNDGETLYLEGGAVVRGLIRARNAENITIRGPGVLDASTRQHKINHLVIRECRQVLLQDFLILDPLGWTIHLSASEHVRLENTRVVGWRANSDGLDIEYSSHIRANGCFWRTNDDCIAIKAIYPPAVQGVPFDQMINPETLGGHSVARIPGDRMEDIRIENCVLWNDQAGQGFEIGFELRIDEIRDIVFRDSDIIHVSGGAFTIHNGDRASISDILIEDVRVESPDRLVDFHVGLSIYSRDCPPAYQRSNPRRKAPPRRPEVANNPWQWYVPPAAETSQYNPARGEVRQVTFRNVHALRRPARASILQGFSKDRNLSKITFENLNIAGETIQSAEQMKLYRKHVANLEFKASPDSPRSH